ncbi:hypothetical protein [Paludibacterium sp. B53371]|uniref:hypothetical protein n=1 Tax=Paludibacterium sp. B53371 TaxID=2806263 RepID=UPI001C04764D|nr:hypothetical protein [Paludibacterium sp. B53371]
MLKSSRKSRLPCWPGILRPLCLMGAEMLLIPLYWQIDLPVADVLLLAGQVLIALVLWRSLTRPQTWQIRLHHQDWQRTAFGGYALRINRSLHQQGGNPGFEICQRHERIRGLIDEEGNIHLFCDMPVQADLQVWQQSWQRLQAGEGTITIQSLSSRGR